MNTLTTTVDTLAHATTTSSTRASTAWRDLAWLLGLALLLRLVFFNGVFGSDDGVYFWRALNVARGEWTSSNYNGALRYGFNLPAGALVAVFGASPFAANLWPLLCSLGEIALVYLAAVELWGRRAGVCAALVLSSMPLHIAVATRLHADPVVSMFVTLGFVLFLFACRRRRAGLFFCCGLAIGGVFWAKELAAITWFAFLFLPLVGRRLPMIGRRWDPLWWYVIAGATLMLLLNFLLMQAITGDPLHLVKVVLGALSRNFIDGGQGEDAANYYLRYLFFDMRHTWIAAVLACAGIAVLYRRQAADGRQADGFYVVVWLLGLLAVLSVFPVSLWPLRLTMKQSNYLTLFIAPLALLAGYFIASLPRRAAATMLALAVAGGTLLGVLQQADYRVFTANSKSATVFAHAHPTAVVVGSTNNSNMSYYYDKTPPHVLSFSEVLAQPRLVAPADGSRDGLYAVFDAQTIDWMPREARLTAPLPCWTKQQRLQPEGLGLGNALAGWAATAAAGLPEPLGRLSPPLQRLARPRPADVYRVEGPDLWCGTRPGAK